MAMKKRIAIVGLGSIGKRHARLLNERDDLQVEFVEPNPEFLSYARNHIGQLPFYDSFEACLDTAPDIVLIATPHSIHASQTIQALTAGADVFCEKPMSDSLTEALKMKQAAQSSGRILNIGFNLHFHPGLRMLKTIMTGNDLGNVLYAHAWVGTYITLVNSISHYQEKQTGALVLDYAHQSDILYWLLGKKPDYIYACALQAGDLDYSSNPNIAVINCEYKTDLISSIHLNYVQMPQRHSYEFVGDKGWAILDLDRNELRIGKRENSNVETKTFTVDHDDIYRTEHQAFLDAVEGHRSPETSAEDGLVSMAICQAAIESWKTSRRVKVQL